MLSTADVNWNCCFARLPADRQTMGRSQAGRAGLTVSFLDRPAGEAGPSARSRKLRRRRPVVGETATDRQTATAASPRCGLSLHSTIRQISYWVSFYISVALPFGFFIIGSFHVASTSNHHVAARCRRLPRHCRRSVHCQCGQFLPIRHLVAGTVRPRLFLRERLGIQCARCRGRSRYGLRVCFEIWFHGRLF